MKQVLVLILSSLFSTSLNAAWNLNPEPPKTTDQKKATNQPPQTTGRPAIVDDTNQAVDNNTYIFGAPTKATSR